MTSMPTSTNPAAPPAMHPDPQSLGRRDVLRQTGLIAGGALALAAKPSPLAATASGGDIVSWDADDLAVRIKNKDVSCAEVMEAYLAQVRRRCWPVASSGHPGR